MMKVTIRGADEKDFAVVFSLIKEFSVFQKTPDRVTITLEQMIQEKDVFRCMVAETDAREIVGFATYFYAFYSWTGKALYLDDLYVVEAFRKRSIGRQLLEHVIILATTEGCKKVRWQVSAWNAEAIRFYKTLGAAIDDTEVNCSYEIKSNQVRE